jgi:hypothetical protein
VDELSGGRQYWYRLDGRTPVPCDARGYEAQYRQASRVRRGGEPGVDLWRVDDTVLFDSCHVSTVFLGLDHNWDPAGPPELFETMTFGSGDEDFDSVPYRTPTWDAAQAMHDQIVAEVRDAVRQRLGGEA